MLITSAARPPLLQPRIQPKPTFTGMPGAGRDTDYTGRQLSELLNTRLRKPQAFLKDFHDISVIEMAGDNKPEGRRASRTYNYNETYWEDEIERRIRMGDINAHTLGVFLTGHGLTIAEAMTRILGSDIAANFSVESIPIPVDQKRIQDQAQTYAQAIIDNQRRVSRKGASTALLIDCHAERSLPLKAVAALPNADTLLNNGISRIFLGTEDPPSPGRAKPYSPRDKMYLLLPEGLVYVWLECLKKDGRLQIVEDGIDARPKRNECTQASWKFEKP